jgi:hypothetical protein
MEAAWGGQILLSQQAVDKWEMPPDAELADHGVHLLRGVSEPQHIFGFILDHPITSDENRPEDQALSPGTANRVFTGLHSYEGGIQDFQGVC